MAQGTMAVFDAFLDEMLDKLNWPILTTYQEDRKRVKNKYARKHYYYVDSYMHLIGEIEEITSNSRAMAEQTEDDLGELPKRLYFHLYQRLHSYGGFEWDTNNFGTNPNL